MSAQCVYVRDVTLVSPCALLMFGGDISIQHQHQLISIDGFITLKVISFHFANTDETISIELDFELSKVYVPLDTFEVISETVY